MEARMPDQPPQLPWTQPDWLAQASDWIDAELNCQGLRRSGPITQPHIRPWSTAMRVPMGSGDLYFKAVAPVLAHEPAITQALARWRPDCTLPVLAADLGRGWMLLPDGGTRLREVIRADRDLRHWEALLPVYAELQIELAGRLPELLAFGTPDRRPAALPALYTQLLDDVGAFRVDQAEGLTSAELRRLRELAPRFAALCEQVAGYNIPDSLHHGDFHDGNIFIRDGGYRFFDWGDSSVAHPFCSLRTTFVSAEISLELDEGDPQLDRLRDAYLEPWTRYEPRESLLAAFTLSQRLASVTSALGWHRVVSPLDEALKAEYGHAVPALLQEFLAAETAGG